MRLISLLTVLAVLALPVWGQQERTGRNASAKVDVNGKVLEQGSGAPVEQATVRLLSVEDSTLVGGVASGAKGAFTLKGIRQGSYLLHVSFVGYAPFFQALRITGRTNPVDVGVIELSDKGIELGEAVVLGKAPEVVVRNDTMEYNADSYKVTEGSMLEDLLKKMPGVEISEEGKITVNGKEIKKVMVDGKEFFSDDPKVASKNLPANMVEKVQVLDKLSDMARMTGFNDGDEETIINLTVKPGMKEGWFGNAYAGYGSQDRYEGNAMVNRFSGNDQITVMGGINNTNNMGAADLASTMFQGMGGGGRRGGWGAQNGITSSGNAGTNFNKQFQKDVLELNGNVRFSHSDNESISNISRQNVLSGDSSSFEEEKNDNRNISNNINANFRLDWKPDTLTQIIIRPEFGHSNTQRDELATSVMLGGKREDGIYTKGDTVNSDVTRNTSDGEGYNVGLRVEFSRRLNNKGRVLSGSLQGGINNTESDGYNWSNTAYISSGSDTTIDQRIRYDNNSYNYRFFLSWVEPLGRNNFLQATYSFSQRQQESLKNAFNHGEGDADTEYTKRDSAQTQNYDNSFISQRISLGFKAVRPKYNYTIGFNADPSYTRSINFIGNTTLSDTSRSVLNFSPMAQFRYNFSRSKSLRLDYDGTTTQPSLTQMQKAPDMSDPTNIKYGNPGLNPRYSSNLRLFMQSFEQETQFAYMLIVDANTVVNEIVSYVINLNDGKGNRETRYENVNGNYGANLRFMMNTPLRNRKFTVNTMSWVSYSNAKGLIGTMKDGQLIQSTNTSRNLILSERGGIDFRSSYLDLGINGNISYNRTSYTLQAENNQHVLNYGVGGRTTIYLPANFKIESDANWSANSGYTDDFKQNEILWNASASKSFLKSNAATLRLKVYDILQQRSNISRSVTANYIQDAEYNTLNAYAMLHFIYRFSIFKGGATMNDAMGGRQQRFGGPQRF